MGGQVLPAFTPPSDEQKRALFVVAAYLKRAGTEAATRLLPDAALLSGQIALLAQMRDDLHQSAALCEVLCDVFDDWPVSTMR